MGDGIARSTPNTDWVKDATKHMTSDEMHAFHVVLSCLECPFSDACLTSRRLFQQQLWQLAAHANRERRRALECQRRMSLSSWRSKPASLYRAASPE